MNRQDLERLASNPHYKMSPAQIKELAQLRQQDVQPSFDFDKHDTGFAKHSTKPRKQDGSTS